MTATVMTVADVGALLAAGLKAVDDELDREFEAGCAAPARVTQLTGLRSQYVFDRMRIVRAGIAEDDASPAQAALFGQLSRACARLGELQASAAGADGWIDQASDGLAKVAAVAGQLAKA